MSQLISIMRDVINSEEINVINARELHLFLNSKQDFSTWIKKRINDYGFLENVDFIKLHKKMELSKTGQYAIEYHLTMDMAKELSMVERTDKGRQARKYFIECEKRLIQILSPITVSKEKQRDFKALNIDNMTRQQKYLVRIQEHYIRVLDEYNDHLAGFVSKNIPHLHYNISTALDVMNVNIGLSLNHIRSELPRKLIA